MFLIQVEVLSLNRRCKSFHFSEIILKVFLIKVEVLSFNRRCKSLLFPKNVTFHVFFNLELEQAGIKLKQFLIAQQNQVPLTQTTLKENKYHLSHNKIYFILSILYAFLKDVIRKRVYL